MGVFDDGYQQALIDAARQPVERPPAGFREAFWATYDATKQEDLSTSEAFNLGNKRTERRFCSARCKGDGYVIRRAKQMMREAGFLRFAAILTEE